MQVYVQGTKKAANEAFSRGEDVVATEYSIHGERSFYLFRFGEDGAVVKFWTKRDPWGNPIAKSYGVLDQKKARIK